MAETNRTRQSYAHSAIRRVKYSLEFRVLFTGQCRRQLASRDPAPRWRYLIASLVLPVILSLVGWLLG